MEAHPREAGFLSERTVGAGTWPVSCGSSLMCEAWPHSALLGLAQGLGTNISEWTHSSGLLCSISMCCVFALCTGILRLHHWALRSRHFPFRWAGRHRTHRDSETVMAVEREQRQRRSKPAFLTSWYFSILGSGWTSFVPCASGIIQFSQWKAAPSSGRKDWDMVTWSVDKEK